MEMDRAGLPASAPGSRAWGAAAQCPAETGGIIDGNTVRF